MPKFPVRQKQIDNLSTTNDSLVVYSFDGSSTWIDYTTQAKSSSGSSWSAFQSTAAGNIMYVGADFEFPGLAMHILTILSKGTGDVVPEIYAERTVLAHGTVTNGPFVVGQYVNGVTSKANGYIERVGSGLIAIRLMQGTFQNGETIYAVTDDPANAPYATTTAAPTTNDEWVYVPNMVNGDDIKWTAYGNTPLQHTGLEKMRLCSMLLAEWQQVAINGTTKYWIRFRVTGAITTVPVLEQIELCTDSTWINDDGFMEFFGAARQLRQVPVEIKKSSIYTPLDEDIDYSTNVGIVETGNEFAGTAKDGQAGVFRIPYWMDTSCKMRMTIWWYAKSTATGNCEFTGAWVVVREGVVLGALTEMVSGVLAPAVGVTGQLIKTRMFGFFDSLLPDDKIAFTLLRNGLGANPYDTLSTNIVIESVKINGYFWRI